MRQYLLFLLTFACAAAQAAEPMSTDVQHRRLMLVVSKHLPGLTLYDADTEEPICRATVGQSGTIYLTAETAESVLLIDPQDRRIIAAIPTGSKTSHMLALTRDEKKIYVSNVQSKTVSVLDVPSHKLAETIQTGSQNQRMTLS